MTYRDLPIHQRINAKGNKVSFNPTVERLRSDLLKRVANRDMTGNTPSMPFYAIQVKHNTFDLPYNYNPHA